MNNCIQKKVKRKTIALETKIAILNRLADGEGSTAVANEFKLGESTIRAIQKRASKINESINCATNESSKRASYSRNIVIEKTEKALMVWIKDSTKKRFRIHGDLIKEKAKQYFNQLKDLEPSENLKFSASNGWLTGFLRRHAAIAEIKQQHTLNSCWKAIWPPECVINRNVTENTSTLSSEINAPAHNISEEGCDTFSENDLVEMIKDETVNDSDIINNLTDYEDGQEEPDSMTVDKIYAGIQLCNKLEKHFLKIDNNSERSLKFQKELRSCISGYRDIYNQLIKQPSPSSQKLITDFMVVTKNKSIGISSSDERDFESVHDKKMRVLDHDE